MELILSTGEVFLSFQAIWLVLQLSMSVIFLLYGRTFGVSHILISSTMNLLLISESIQTNVSHVMFIMTFMLITRQVIQHITSLTYTFVKQNGTWMLADFLIN